MSIRLFNESDYPKILDIYAQSKLDELRYEDEKYELLPFEFGQAIELFKKFAKSSQMLDALKDGLTRIGSQVIMTPLSLLMLLNVVEEHDELDLKS